MRFDRVHRVECQVIAESLSVFRNGAVVYVDHPSARPLVFRALAGKLQHVRLFTDCCNRLECLFADFVCQTNLLEYAMSFRAAPPNPRGHAVVAFPARAWGVVGCLGDLTAPIDGYRMVVVSYASRLACLMFQRFCYRWPGLSREKLPKSPSRSSLDDHDYSLCAGDSLRVEEPSEEKGDRGKASASRTIGGGNKLVAEASTSTATQTEERVADTGSSRRGIQSSPQVMIAEDAGAVKDAEDPDRGIFTGLQLDKEIIFTR